MVNFQLQKIIHITTETKKSIENTFVVIFNFNFFSFKVTLSRYQPKTKKHK